MLTIITPCSRPQFLLKLKESIQFEKIDKWIIVYDTSRDRSYTKMFDESKIEEVFCSDLGQAGHPQRNFGVKMVTDGHIYFLDDDNIIHPEFWNLTFEPDYFYTFDQLRTKKGTVLKGIKETTVLKGNKIKVNHIDTAMFVVPLKMFEDNSWDITKYNADGFFITQVFAKYSNMHKYINVIASYYNFLV